MNTDTALAQPLREVLATRIDAQGRRTHLDPVAEETAVAMVYNGRSQAVMMATPTDLDDFALGFSLTESIVTEPGECRLLDVQHGGDGIELRMAIPESRFDALAARNRSFTGRTGCGVCGADSLATAIRPVRRLPEGAAIPISEVRKALAALDDGQTLNRRCHGLHAAGFAHPDGLLIREDVGRHNALDKVVGARTRAGLSTGFLIVTSRASYEMVHKSAEAGVALLVAISAPTALAIRLAERAGITLVAFAREDGFSVYSHPGRLRG